MAGRAVQVPAPWGLALVLGIQEHWDAAEPFPAGQLLDLRHGRSAPNFSEVLAWIEASYWRAHQVRLMEVISWTAPLPGALALGTVQVVTCTPQQAGRAGYRLQLCDPRPAWVITLPPTRDRAGGAAIPPAASSRPVAGPLFESR